MIIKKCVKIIPPILILLVATAACGIMHKFKKTELVKAKGEMILPLVEVIKAGEESVVMTVKTQGTVTPRTETGLISEVSGKIIRVSPSFYTGGFFKKNEVMLEIEPDDYIAAIARAEAELAGAKLKLAREEAFALQAQKDWNELGKGNASSLVLRKPQLEEARASLNYAEKDLQKAKRFLKKTRILAPYPCMIKKKEADVGRYIEQGSEVAHIFAIDYAEIRLPVTSVEMAFVNLPGNHLESETISCFPNVTVFGEVAGEKQQWQGKIVRTEGVFDPRSRVLYVVARVPDPYATELPIKKKADVPLMMGLFIEAEIEGITLPRAVTIPKIAIIDADMVLMLDHQDKLRKRRIEVLRTDGPRAIIKKGINPGETICLTALEYVSEGMKVKPVFVTQEKNKLNLSGKSGA